MKNHLKKGQEKFGKDFPAQDWLFREFLEKMKKNNVKKLLVYSVDKFNTPLFFEYGIAQKDRNNISEKVKD